MDNDVYGFQRTSNGYDVLKNGEYFCHCETQEEAAQIIEKMLYGGYDIESTD